MITEFSKQTSIILHLKEDIETKEEVIKHLTEELAEAKHQHLLLLEEGFLDKNADRIEELEEALRESVRITADREVALDAETNMRIESDEKVC